MQFTLMSHDSIKSIEQRRLVALWKELAAGRAFPSFPELQPQLESFTPQALVVWTIENAGTQRRFRALFNGSRVGEVFNSAWAGKTMDEVIPAPLTDFAIEAANECAATGCAIYTILSTWDRTGHRIDCERLLLPFGSDGSAVEQLVGSLQLISVGAAVERSSVLENFQAQAEVVFAGRIQSGGKKFQAATLVPAIDTAFAGNDEREDEPDAPETPIQAGEAATAVAEHREARRQKVVKAGTVTFGKNSLTCVIRDISKTGALLEIAKSASVPDIFALMIEMESTKRRCTVVWRKEKQIGVRFS